MAENYITVKMWHPKKRGETKSLEKLIDEVSWEEVILDPNIKKEIVDYSIGIAYPDIYIDHGIDPIRNMLLIGAPGTGKTMSVKAMANQNDFDMLVVKCSDITDKWYGNSEKKLAGVFIRGETIAKKNKKPCIIYFDEIDALAGKRDKVNSHEVTQRIMSTFLVNMDGIYSKKNVYIVGSTNLPETLDPAITRPGRFDKIIKIDLPKETERRELFKLYINKVKTKAKTNYIGKIRYQALAKASNRFSGADISYIIKNVCSKYAFSKYDLEIKDKQNILQTKDFLKAVQNYDFNRGGSRKGDIKIKGFN